MTEDPKSRSGSGERTACLVAGVGQQWTRGLGITKSHSLVSPVLFWFLKYSLRDTVRQKAAVTMSAYSLLPPTQLASAQLLPLQEQLRKRRRRSGLHPSRLSKKWRKTAQPVSPVTFIIPANHSNLINDEDSLCPLIGLHLLCPPSWWNDSFFIRPVLFPSLPAGDVPTDYQQWCSCCGTCLRLLLAWNVHVNPVWAMMEWGCAAFMRTETGSFSRFFLTFFRELWTNLRW